MLYWMCEKSGLPPTWQQLEHAIRRNFGGMESDELDPLEEFKQRIHIRDVPDLQSLPKEVHVHVYIPTYVHLCGTYIYLTSTGQLRMGPPVTRVRRERGQGHIELPKAARGHATSYGAHIDSIVLSVTKNNVSG